MKTVTINSSSIKSFDAEIDSAMMMLAMLIARDHNIRFWFGSDRGTVSHGGIVLYIDVEFGLTIEQYQYFDIDKCFNEKYLSHSKEEQDKIKSDYINNYISPHEYFMMKIGNQLKNTSC